MMKFCRDCFVLIFMLAATPAAMAEDCKFLQTGVASVYSEKFNGRKTSWGDILDLEQPTAAHPSLEKGTRIKAVDVKTNNVSYLTVNDKGPFAKKRILDVTHVGARDLGFEQTKRKSFTGTRRIKLYVCN